MAQVLKKVVLVIDDSISIRRAVRSDLESAGYTVREAVNGAEGIRAIETDAEVKVILCDINMPIVDGIGLLEHFANTGRFRRTPVVMLTSEGDPMMVSKAKALGARGWLTKPYNKEHLLLVIEAALQKAAA